MSDFNAFQSWYYGAPVAPERDYWGRELGPERNMYGQPIGGPEPVKVLPPSCCAPEPLCPMFEPTSPMMLDPPSRYEPPELLPSRYYEPPEMVLPELSRPVVREPLYRYEPPELLPPAPLFVPPEPEPLILSRRRAEESFEPKSFKLSVGLEGGGDTHFHLHGRRETDFTVTTAIPLGLGTLKIHDKPLTPDLDEFRPSKFRLIKP